MDRSSILRASTREQIGPGRAQYTHLLDEVERTTDAGSRRSLKGKRTFDGRIWDDVRGIGGLRDCDRIACGSLSERLGADQQADAAVAVEEGLIRLQLCCVPGKGDQGVGPGCSLVRVIHCTESVAAFEKPPGLGRCFRDDVLRLYQGHHLPLGHLRARP